MSTPRHDPFPFEAVRDLIGILRAMYATAKAEGNDRRFTVIRRVGRQLRVAIDLALEHEPGTAGYAKAWRQAESATLELSGLVDCTTPLEPTLDAATRRVRNAAAPDASRELSRRARLSRG
jgi:hypothetical protein